MSQELSSPPGNARQLRWVAFALLLFPMLVVYSALWTQSRSVPMQDDFFAIVRFALVYKAQPSAWMKLMYTLTAQHNEYKLVVEHAIVAADMALTGHLHFGVYIWIGNLSLIPITWLFWSNLRQNDSDLTLRLFRFIPVCWLLFQLNYVENLDWAMCGLQTMPVVLFTLASLHFLVRPGIRFFALSCICAVLACLSSANGFLLAPLGVLFLITNQRAKQLISWCAAYVIALVIYLSRYHPFTPPNYRSGSSFSDKLLFFLSFLGAAAENMHHFPLRYGSIAVGFLICLVAVIAARTGFARQGSFYFYALLWCLITAALVADKRVGEGLDVALSMRYKIYSDIVLICVYSYGIAQFDNQRTSQMLIRRRRLVYCTLLFAIVSVASVSDVFGYKFLATRRKFSEEALASFVADPDRNTPDVSAVGTSIADGSPEVARQVLLRAIQTGIYRLPRTQRH